MSETIEGAATDAANPVDIYVGRRIRMRRKLLGVSQDQLAAGLGISFQQVQKYERGANRISASKIYRAAQILTVPVTYFFEGFDSVLDDAGEIDRPDGRALLEFLQTTEGLELAGAFPRVPAAMRRVVLNLIKSMADDGLLAPEA